MRKTLYETWGSGGHSGSAQMLADIDDACKQAGIMPDAFLSGHAHSLQRYIRTVPFNGKTVKIPYIVTGCGGHGGQAVPVAKAKTGGNPSFDFSYKGWGYTKAVISAKNLALSRVDCFFRKRSASQVESELRAVYRIKNSAELITIRQSHD